MCDWVVTWFSFGELDMILVEVVAYSDSSLELATASFDHSSAPFAAQNSVVVVINRVAQVAAVGAFLVAAAVVVATVIVTAIVAAVVVGVGIAAAGIVVGVGFGVAVAAAVVVDIPASWSQKKLGLA
jgi:hypothetical protein